MSNGEQTTGFLRVAVSSAEGTIPTVGARVTVRAEDGTEWVVFTDESGLTSLLALPAPPAASSQSALKADPFAIYRVTVEKDGFYKQTTEHVPIFAGITARQGVSLIGLAEFLGETFSPEESTDTVKENPQALQNGRRNA